MLACEAPAPPDEAADMLPSDQTGCTLTVSVSVCMCVSTEQLSCQPGSLPAESSSLMLVALYASLHMLHVALVLLTSPHLHLCTLQAELVAGSLAGALHTAQAAADSACDAEIQLFEHLVDKAEALLQSPQAGGDGGFCASCCVLC